MTGFGSGAFAQSNTEILTGADVSARASDFELQVVLAEGNPAVLAALVFHLCEQAERLSPHIARIVDERGYPYTSREHVLYPIQEGRDMHLRPFRRRFLVMDDVYTWHHQDMDHLFGRPIDVYDNRKGISMSLTNESSDALTGYGGASATDEEKQVISGYTRRLFAEVMDDVDLRTEAEQFLGDIQAIHQRNAE